MEEIYQSYKDRAAFLFVYIQEAHASEEWHLDSNEEDEVVFDQPVTLTGRRDIANEFCSAHGFTLPTVIDDMDNTVDKSYAARPERMFIVDADGKIAYAAAQGPWGFRPKHIQRWLRKNLGPP